MQISTHMARPRPTHQRSTKVSQSLADSSPDQVTLGESAPHVGMAALGALTGAVGFGAPAALTMNGVKDLMTGNYLSGGLQTGIGAVLTAGLGITGYGVALMSASAGDTDAGVYGWYAGAAATTAAAGLAIF